MATSQSEMGIWRDGDNPLVAEVDEKYTRWRQDKRIHEQAWYLNAAFVRGLQYVSWNDQLQKLTTLEAPAHRQRIVVNRIFSKFNARRAKFLKALPSPFVIPASPDRDDRLDAEATQKALEYVLRKERWEERYRAVLGWANICSKGFVWLHWDQTKPATIAVPDQLGGMEWTEQPGVGDVVLEVGSPFEVLVADSGIQNISDQPEIMRVKIREVSELTARFGKKAEGLKGEVSTEEVFQYQKQIATLSSKGVAGYHFGASTEREDSFKEFVVVKELFTRPCAKYPKGRWIVTAGGKLLSKEMELPLELWNSPDPYPCVEFSDVENVGQFWPTTYVEQQIPLQKEYNMVRSKAAEILRLAAGPKILTPLQTQFPKNAWNCVDDATEVLTKRGWTNIPNVGDELLSYDPFTDTLRWCQATHVHSYTYDGQLFRFYGRNIDALVTPNHRWVVQTRKNDRSFQRKFIETLELSQEPSGKWAIPVARRGELSSNSNNLAFFELLGWVLAEGHYYKNSGNAIKITQHKSAGRKRIEELLQTLGMGYTKSPRDFYIHSTSAKVIRETLPDKTLPIDLIVNASHEQLTALLCGLISGDGSIRKSNGQVRFHNTSLDLCEKVATIGVLLGRRSSVRDAVEEHICFGKYIGAKQYVVYLGATQKIGKNTAQYNAVAEPYQGRVWCPTVETGAVVYRRNGTHYIGGNSEPLEVVRYQWYPGVPEPKVVAPPPMSQDAWNYMRLVKDEFDEVTNLYPQAQGSAGGATSGFQTNLLQEATDSIHAPDIRAHELSFIKLCYKIRHVMKLTYDVTRLLPITGRNMVPQVMEFSSDRINVNSEIVILGKTGLSQSPAVRTQQVIELWNARILGDQNDPKNQNRVLTLIDAEGIGPLQEEKRRDVDLARYEIDLMNRGDASKEPQPYEDHDVHWTEHTDFMKSFEYLGLAPEIQNLHKIHLVLHAKFIDPMKAVQLAFDIGVPEVGEALKAQIMPPQAPPVGVPPQGPPPGVPPGGAMSPPQ